MKIRPEGDCAITVQLGETSSLETHRKIRELVRNLEENPIPEFLEIVPGFISVTVFYHPLLYIERGLLPYEQAEKVLRKRMSQLSGASFSHPREVAIPVCYGGEFGPDLEEVARYHSLTPDEVIEFHTRELYTVYMIGFAPGFPYLGGMSQKIATPRRPTPRLTIPPGSVGIGGSQTGIYPLESPGGWQLIGRTPIQLFDAARTEPSLLQAGDQVRFYPISEQQYRNWGEQL